MTIFPAPRTWARGVPGLPSSVFKSTQSEDGGPADHGGNDGGTCVPCEQLFGFLCARRARLGRVPRPGIRQCSHNLRYETYCTPHVLPAKHERKLLEG